VSINWRSFVRLGESPFHLSVPHRDWHRVSRFGNKARRTEIKPRATKPKVLTAKRNSQRELACKAKRDKWLRVRRDPLYPYLYLGFHRVPLEGNRRIDFALGCRRSKRPQSRRNFGLGVDRRRHQAFCGLASKQRLIEQMR